MRSPTLRGSRVLITGAAGFIGAHLAACLLEREAAVVGLVRASTDRRRLSSLDRRIELETADLRDHAAIERILGELRPSHVFHAATVRDEDDWRTTLETHTTAALNLLRASSTPELESFVQLGSATEYGAAEAPFEETVRPQPTTFYGAARAAGTVLLLQHAAAHELPLTVLRIFYAYGPLEPERRLIPTAIRAIDSGRPLALTAPGYGRDLVYVDDVVDACCAAATRPGSGTVINVGSGKPSSNEEIVAEIGRLLGKRVRIAATEHPPRPWDRSDACAELSRARQLLDWRPKTSLSQGLRQTLRWWKERDES